MRIRYTSAGTGRAVKKALVYNREEHGISRENVDYDATRIIERLKANGHCAYIVGGAVRDLMLGKKPKDFDIVSDATPSRIKRLFRNSRVIGRRFRLVHVFFGQKIFEVATFRSLQDGTTSNTYGCIEDDVQRRDFSLNALFYDPQDQTVVDYVGGVLDIRRKRMKPVIPLAVIFVDDPVRMIRAIKYAAMTDFKLPLALRWRIKAQAPLLSSISASRLTEEVLKIVKSGCAQKIINNLHTFGLYRYIQPNAVKAINSSSRFSAAYQLSLEELDKKVRGDRELRSGDLLFHLIRDFLDEEVNWRFPDVDPFKSALKAARGFISPINPPRMELEEAVRFVFQSKGLIHKKRRPTDFRSRANCESPNAPPESGQTIKKRRRRRSRTARPSSTLESSALENLDLATKETE